MRYLILGATMAMLCGTQSFAQSIPMSADQIVGIRKSVMDLQGGMTAAMKAGIEQKLDVKVFADGAKALASSAKLIPAMFPVGTEKAGDTKAKAAIWADPADYAKASKALETEADKLVVLAEAGDKDGFAAQFGAVGKTCGACHRAYKERD